MQRDSQTTGWTDRQREQFEIGRAFHDGGFPRAAPHDESEWRWWLKGWDCAQMDRELDEHLAGTP